MMIPRVLALACLLVALLALGSPQERPELTGLQGFSSYEELVDFIEVSRWIAWRRSLFPPLGWMMVRNSEIPITMEHSQTNVQVAGVDEPDVVKTDGRYLYVISGDRVYIVLAWPAENSGVVSWIRPPCTPLSLFLSGDTLIIFGERGGRTHVLLFSVTDPKAPALEHQYSIDGRFFDARLIGTNLYVITNAWIGTKVRLPEIWADGETSTMRPEDIYCFTFGSLNQFTIVFALDIDGGRWSSKALLTGFDQILYVSKQHIYLLCDGGQSIQEQWQGFLDAVGEFLPEDLVRRGRRAEGIGEIVRLAKEIRGFLDNMDAPFWFQTRQYRFRVWQPSEERTFIYKLAMSDGGPSVAATGEVPGRVLNQFSVDEHASFLRVATTTGWYGANHLYVLDETLRIVGKLENLAPGERIYSVRFMGARAYLVTFKKVDPLFVLDLGDPMRPRVLGELKVPGFSTYLHPYDENHIIGIGKDVLDMGDFAWYQGLKISLFDVSDPSGPRELSTYIIGDRGTESLALYDHHAILFSRRRNLLVLPVLLAEHEDENHPPHEAGKPVWQGACVFSVSPENGLVLRGTVSHLESGRLDRSLYVKRALYIGDVLYTISDEKVVLSSLETLEILAEVSLT
jgi:uncharacterized secreted protein with C-terminal beta-propeller domain